MEPLAQELQDDLVRLAVLQKSFSPWIHGRTADKPGLVVVGLQFKWNNCTL